MNIKQFRKALKKHLTDKQINLLKNEDKMYDKIMIKYEIEAQKELDMFIEEIGIDEDDENAEYEKDELLCELVNELIWVGLNSKRNKLFIINDRMNNIFSHVNICKKCQVRVYGEVQDGIRVLPWI